MFYFSLTQDNSYSIMKRKFIIADKAFKSLTGDFIGAALAEDIGSGDITTEATVGKNLKGTAELIAKESFTVSGIDIVKEVFKQTCPRPTFKTSYKDGDVIKKGAVIMTVSGNLQGLLKGERVALNIMQRLSSITTETEKFVKITGKKITVLDTRKTTPCMRLLEKYAVFIGGAKNHRLGLFDQIMIKENHITAAGSITNAVSKVRKKYGDIFIEVETQNLKEVKEALENKANIILLDNMTPSQIKKCVEVIDGDAMTEISGGVNLKNIKSFINTGADFISVGALTHSSGSVDISLIIK